MGQTEFWGWNTDSERFGNEQAESCAAVSMEQGIFFNTELLHWREARRFAEWVLASEQKRKEKTAGTLYEIFGEGN